MANAWTGGTTATGSSASTLADIIGRVRGYLDDTTGDEDSYGWPSVELTGYLNESVNELCRKLRLIEDADTAAICTHALLANGHTLTLSPRITGIERVELNSTGAVLIVVDHVRDMDARFPGWKSADASVPQYLIKNGLGTLKARVYPATLLADTINLTVHRLPLADLDWDADQASEPEIPSTYHDPLYYGILARAYRKHDVDTENNRLAGDFEKKWEDRVEEIRKAHLHKETVPHTAAPAEGWM